MKSQIRPVFKSSSLIYDAISADIVGGHFLVMKTTSKGVSRSYVSVLTVVVSINLISCRRRAYPYAAELLAAMIRSRLVGAVPTNQAKSIDDTYISSCPVNEVQIKWQQYMSLCRNGRQANDNKCVGLGFAMLGTYVIASMMWWHSCRFFALVVFPRVAVGSVAVFP